MDAEGRNTSRVDLSTFGEPLLRLSAPTATRLQAATYLQMYPGGAEANVAALLSRLGHTCRWVGALPQNDLGRFIANHLRAAGVDLSAVVWSGSGRLGVYYLEPAAPPRPTRVIYDRAHSCITDLASEQIDWNALLHARLLHLTGITAGLGPSCLALLREVLERAVGAGVPVSFDVNYRRLLWEASQAASTLRTFLSEIEVLFCSQTDARVLFGLDGMPEEVIRRLASLTSARLVVLTLGEGGVLALHEGQMHSQTAYPTSIVDRIGAGDAMAAGVIHGWLEGDVPKGLRYGALLAALALTQHGDMVITSAEELEALLADDAGPIVR